MLQFSLLFLTFVFLACHGPKSELRQPSALVQERVYEKVEPDSMMVSLNHKKKQKLISLTLSYVGKRGLSQILSNNENKIETLVRNALSEKSYMGLQTDQGQKVFQNEVLESLNSFIKNSPFVRVQVRELREI